MKYYITQTGNYKIDDIGIVHVLVKRAARRMIARWKSGALNVTVPEGTTIDDLRAFLLRNSKEIEKIRPQAPYSLGQKLQFPEFAVTIASQSHAPDKMLLNFKGHEGQILVGTAWDMASPDTIKQIGKMVCRMAQSMAPDLLIPMAREVAEQVGRRPMMWTISNGHRVLGYCSAKGVIALSYALVLYPDHLRRYVVCHELAHLSEMNHSPLFHQICNAYCQGREQELREQLRAHSRKLQQLF